MALERIGRYIPDTVIAHGDIATLYSATDTQLQRIVALRVLPGDIVESEGYYARLKAYGPLLLKLNHPAIVPIYDIGSAEGQVYMAMRHMEGGSLADQLVRGPLPAAQAISIFQDIAEALDHAHKQGLVHSGLRPTRILFDGNGNAYLSGFGQPTLRDVYGRLAPDTVLRWMTAVGPEQLQPDPALDASGDQYALAVVLYEMLAGHPPFHAQTSRLLAAMHLHNPAPPLPDTGQNIPPVLNNIIGRAMAKTPPDRFASVGEMADTLASAGLSVARRQRRTERLDGGVAAPGVAQTTRRPSVGCFVLAGILVLVVAVLAFFLGNTLLRGGAEETVDPAALSGQYSSLEDGIVVSLPPGWQAVAASGIKSPIEEAPVILASRSGWNTAGANTDRLDFAVSEPVFLVQVTNAANAPGILPLPRLVLEALKGEIPPRDELSFGVTRGSTVDGKNMVFADFSGRSLAGNTPFAGRIVTVLWADRVGLFIGVAPANQWESFHPTFNGMIQSLKLLEPVEEPG